MKRNMPNGLVIVDNLLLIKSMMKMMIVPLGTTPHSQAQHSRKYRTVCFRWIWSKPKDWWREKRVSHLLTSSTAPSTRPAPLTGHLTDPHYRRNFSTICASRRHVDDVFHTLVREIRKRDEEGEFKENETSRWKKVWNNIFKTIKRGRRKV